MTKRIMKCDMCGEEAFAEGDCPNEIMQSSGYIPNEDLSFWVCSEKCKVIAVENGEWEK